MKKLLTATAILISLTGYSYSQDYINMDIAELERLSNLGDTKAMFHLGYEYYEIHEYKKAFNIFEDCAELKDIDCWIPLAISYSNGVGVDRDLIKSYSLFYIIKKELYGKNEEADKFIDYQFDWFHNMSEMSEQDILLAIDVAKKNKNFSVR